MLIVDIKKETFYFDFCLNLTFMSVQRGHPGAYIYCGFSSLNYTKHYELASDQ